MRTHIIFIQLMKTRIHYYKTNPIISENILQFIDCGISWRNILACYNFYWLFLLANAIRLPNFKFMLWKLFSGYCQFQNKNILIDYFFIIGLCSWEVWFPWVVKGLNEILFQQSSLSSYLAIGTNKR